MKNKNFNKWFYACIGISMTIIIGSMSIQNASAIVYFGNYPELDGTPILIPWGGEDYVIQDLTFFINSYEFSYYNYISEDQWNTIPFYESGLQIGPYIHLVSSHSPEGTLRHRCIVKCYSSFNNDPYTIEFDVYFTIEFQNTINFLSPIDNSGQQNSPVYDKLGFIYVEINTPNIDEYSIYLNGNFLRNINFGGDDIYANNQGMIRINITDVSFWDSLSDGYHQLDFHFNYIPSSDKYSIQNYVGSLNLIKNTTTPYIDLSSSDFQFYLPKSPNLGFRLNTFIPEPLYERFLMIYQNRNNEVLDTFSYIKNGLDCFPSEWQGIYPLRMNEMIEELFNVTFIRYYSQSIEPEFIFESKTITIYQDISNPNVLLDRINNYDLENLTDDSIILVDEPPTFSFDLDALEQCLSTYRDYLLNPSDPSIVVWTINPIQNYQVALEYITPDWDYTTPWVNLSYDLINDMGIIPASIWNNTFDGLIHLYVRIQNMVGLTGSGAPHEANGPYATFILSKDCTAPSLKEWSLINGVQISTDTLVSAFDTPAIEICVEDTYISQIQTSFLHRYNDSIGNLHEDQYVDEFHSNLVLPTFSTIMTVSDSFWTSHISHGDELDFIIEAIDYSGNYFKQILTCIKDIRNPSFSYINTANGTIYGNQSPVFTVNIHDICGEVSYQLSGPNYTFSERFCLSPFLSDISWQYQFQNWDLMNDGTYIINFYAWDIVNNLGFSTLQFVKDTKLPLLNVSTINNLFSILPPTFSISLFDENPLRLEYSLNGTIWCEIGFNKTYQWTDEYNLSLKEWDQIPDGPGTICFRFIDIAQHTTYVWFSFIKDTTPPEFELIIPNNCTDGFFPYNILGWEKEFRWNLILDGILFENAPIKASGYINLYYYQITITDGKHNCRLQAINQFGLSYFVNFSILLDSQQPVIFISTPTTTFGLDSPTFKVNINETNPSLLQYRWGDQDWMTIEANLTANWEGNVVFPQEKWDIFPDESYSITFFVQDVVGYTGCKSIIVIKNTSKPVFEYYGYGNNSYCNGTWSYEFSPWNANYQWIMELSGYSEKLTLDSNSANISFQKTWPNLLDGILILKITAINDVNIPYTITLSLILDTYLPRISVDYLSDPAEIYSITHLPQINVAADQSDSEIYISTRNSPLIKWEGSIPMALWNMSSNSEIILELWAKDPALNWNRTTIKYQRDMILPEMMILTQNLPRYGNLSQCGVLVTVFLSDQSLSEFAYQVEDELIKIQISQPCTQFSYQFYLENPFFANQSVFDAYFAEGKNLTISLGFFGTDCAKNIQMDTILIDLIPIIGVEVDQSVNTEKSQSIDLNQTVSTDSENNSVDFDILQEIPTNTLFLLIAVSTGTMVGVTWIRKKWTLR